MFGRSEENAAEDFLTIKIIINCRLRIKAFKLQVEQLHSISFFIRSNFVTRLRVDHY